MDVLLRWQLISRKDDFRREEWGDCEIASVGSRSLPVRVSVDRTTEHWRESMYIGTRWDHKLSFHVESWKLSLLSDHVWKEFTGQTRSSQTRSRRVSRLPSVNLTRGPLIEARDGQIEVSRLRGYDAVSLGISGSFEGTLGNTRAQGFTSQRSWIVNRSAVETSDVASLDTLVCFWKLRIHGF